MSSHTPDPLPAAAVPPPAQTGVEPHGPDEFGGSRARRALHEMLTSNWIVTVLAIVLALAIGGVLIALADPEVQATLAYFFSRPSDFFSAAWTAVSEAYAALFAGAIYDPQAETFQQAIRPLTESLTVAVPLILAGLGLAIGFRAGLFNIGAQGQIILGGIFAGYIGFTFALPFPLHLLLAVIGAALGGALWAGIAGVLKARTGAHEVIVTIMLNNIAIFLIAYLLSLDAFQRPGSNNPVSPPIPDSAAYPLLLGPSYRLHLGFLLAIAAAFFTWWLMERSTIGFRFRAVGANPHAARTAGISVNSTYVWVMLVSGAFAGLAGSVQVLGTERVLTAGVAASYGFDAITVALLGRSKPLGTFMAGILFGGLRAGGVVMQARTGTPIDIVLVVQSLIVLFIAAPPLVRAVFRLPAPGLPQARPVATTTVKEASA